jgi:3-methyladenine DNA glycosylase AlkC
VTKAVPNLGYTEVGVVAEQLKHFFGETVVRFIARELAGVHPPFRQPAFVRDCMHTLEQRELTARAWHIAEAMAAHLPQSFPAAARIIVASLGTELASTSTFGMAPFRYLPHVFFVQKYGLEDFEPAMQAQYALTQRFTAESSIRAFLIRYPEATLTRLREWASDPSPHVRRLVSEGTRPRLPWAPRLPAFQKDPRPVLQLLELLKDDRERYVQRSVANNLNDIGKDHPDLAATICREWARRAPPGRAWIVRHALRSLVKKSHPVALATLGVGEKPQVKLEQVKLLPKSINIGGELRFSCVLTSTGTTTQTLLVDYAVHFIKANGASKPKVFKLKRLSLEDGARADLRGKLSFANLSTRRHYPGRHRMDLLINGVTYPLAAFDVRDSAQG